MGVTEIISALGLIGLGGLIKSIFDYFIENKKRKSETKHDIKQTRYQAIILLCYSLIYFEKEKNKLSKFRPDINTKEELYNEIAAEWMNMTLYASDDVIISLKLFLQNPKQNTFNIFTLNMRKDLYGIRTKLKSDDLIIKNEIML
jgi:hypothetical protein